MSDDRRRKRLNLSFSMASPLQQEAWNILHTISAGQRTEAVCRAVCRLREQEALLEAVRAAIREELGNASFVSSKEETIQPQTGDVDDNVLGFLLALQNDGGDE